MLGWVDLETTGLDPDHDLVLEVAFVVTDDDLTVKGFYEAVIRQDILDIEAHADDFVKKMHTDNGLWSELSAGLSRIEAETELINMYTAVLGSEKVPLCGSTVHFDREFLKRAFPYFERLFHYRNIDVSTYKETFRRWLPNLPEPPLEANKRHRAADDIFDSIALAEHYREFLLRAEAA